MSQRSYSDVPNRIVNLFLQEAGAQYDRARGLQPYRSMTPEVLLWFDGVCAYCAAPWEVEEHLVPRNRRAGGLHSWGNVVPACRPCNRAKMARSWSEHLAAVAGVAQAERQGRIRDFIQHHRYAPNTSALIPLLEDLYATADRQARDLVTQTLHLAAEAVGALLTSDDPLPTPHLISEPTRTSGPAA